MSAWKPTEYRHIRKLRNRIRRGETYLQKHLAKLLATVVIPKPRG